MEGSSSSSSAPLSPELIKTIKDFKIVQQCGDDGFARPVIVIAAANLPDPKVCSYNSLLKYFTEELDHVVESDYVIILFYYGMTNRPPWSWMREAYTLLGRKYKKNLKNLYVVHPTFWHKIAMQVMNFMISSKFLDKIVYINRLRELESHVRTTNLYIPEVVKSYDLRTFGKDSSVSSAIVQKTDGQFGVPLATLMAEGQIPIVLLETIEYIRKRGLKSVGIFRRSPSQVNLIEAIDKYNRGEKVNLGDDIHLAAVLLKRFIRDIPGSIVPIDLSTKITELNLLDGPEINVQKCAEIIQQLKNENLVVLSYLIKLLVEVVEQSSINQMNLGNLTIIFAPNLVPPEIVLADLTTTNYFIQKITENYESMLAETYHRFVLPVVTSYNASLASTSPNPATSSITTTSNPVAIVSTSIPAISTSTPATSVPPTTAAAPSTASATPVPTTTSTSTATPNEPPKIQFQEVSPKEEEKVEQQLSIPVLVVEEETTKQEVPKTEAAPVATPKDWKQEENFIVAKQTAEKIVTEGVKGVDQIAEEEAEAARKKHEEEEAERKRKEEEAERKKHEEEEAARKKHEEEEAERKKHEEEATRKKQEEEEAARKKQEEEAERKKQEEEEAERKKHEEEEAARKKQEEEAERKKHEEEEAARKKQEEEEAERKKQEEEEAARKKQEEEAERKKHEEEEAERKKQEEESKREEVESGREEEEVITREEEGEEESSRSQLEEAQTAAKEQKPESESEAKEVESPQQEESKEQTGQEEDNENEEDDKEPTDSTATQAAGGKKKKNKKKKKTQN